MLGFSLGLLLACIAVVWAPGPAVGWFSLFACLLLALAFVFRRGRRALLAGVFVGAVLAGLSVSSHLSETVPGDGSIHRFEGQVVDQVGGSDSVTRFVLLVEPSGSTRVMPDRIRVSWHRPDVGPRSGERWSLPLRLQAPLPDVLPGGFDTGRWRFRNGYAATARVAGHLPALRLDAGNSSLDRLRDTIAVRISDALGDRPESALIRGVTVGDRSAFEPSHWHVLNATGTTHLVAISGLHIGLIAAVGFLLGRRLMLPGVFALPANVAGAFGGFLPALFYAALAGFALPTLRALAMFGVLVLLLLLRRRVPPGAGLALALAVVLLIDPLAVLDAGFYLSFALVAFVLLVVAAGDKPGRVTAFLQVQWVTGLAVLPVLLLVFGNGPPVGPLANAVAVPVFSVVVVPLSLLGVMLDLLGAGAVAVWLWHLVAECIEALWTLLEWLGNSPELAIPELVPVWIVALGLVAILAVILPGPGIPRAALALAMLPALVGIRGTSEPMLEHWALRDDGHVWMIRANGQKVVRVEVSRPALRNDLIDWLESLARDPSATLIVEPRGRTGPSSLAGVVSVWRPGQVLMADAQRAGSPRARHCDGIEANGWRLSARPRGNGAGRECVLEWPVGAGELRVTGDQLAWSVGEHQWRLARDDWADVRSVRPDRNGAATVTPRRRYWWRQ